MTVIDAVFVLPIENIHLMTTLKTLYRVCLTWLSRNGSKSSYNALSAFFVKRNIILKDSNVILSNGGFSFMCVFHKLQLFLSASRSIDTF